MSVRERHRSTTSGETEPHSVKSMRTTVIVTYVSIYYDPADGAPSAKTAPFIGRKVNIAKSERLKG